MDVITINGDIVAHGNSVKEDATPEEIETHYTKVFFMHQTLQRIFTSEFPTTPVVITFGDSDNEFINQPTIES